MKNNNSKYKIFKVFFIFFIFNNINSMENNLNELQGKDKKRSFFSRQNQIYLEKIKNDESQDLLVSNYLFGQKVNFRRNNRKY